MGLFTPEDPSYDINVRQTGFYRYKQLLSFHAGHWMCLNLATVAGALPLAGGIAYSVLTSSVLVLLPCSVLGGMLLGPFLAGMYDAILRGLRDDPMNWRKAYCQSWRQNWKDSLLPGGVLGLLAGLYAFMAHLFWWSQTPVSAGTLALCLFSMLLVLLLGTLYWPQVVLFRQTVGNRLRNILLFAAKYLWRVLGAAALQMVYLAVMVLFAPWTILLIPLLGFWYILFLSQLMIYEQLDEAFQIEPDQDGEGGGDEEE